MGAGLRAPRGRGPPCQATTWLHADIAAGGDLAEALGALRARVLLVPSRTDLYFPVADNALELPHLAHGLLRPIETIWWHRAGNPRENAEDLAALRRAVRDWLDAPAPARTGRPP